MLIADLEKDTDAQTTGARVAPSEEVKTPAHRNVNQSASPNPAPPTTGKLAWRTVLALPIATAIAFAVHIAASQKELPVETTNYSIFLGIVFGIGVALAIGQAIWIGL